MTLRLYTQVAAAIMLLALTMPLSAQRLIPAFITEGELHQRTQWSSDLGMPVDLAYDIHMMKELNGELTLFNYITSAGAIATTYDGESLTASEDLLVEEGVFRVLRLRDVGDSVFVCGALMGSNPQELFYHNGSAWSSLPAVDLSRITDLTSYQGQLYVSGLAIDGGSGLFRWNGENWEEPEAPINADVYCILEHDGELIAGGDFTDIAGQAINYFARFDGTSWSQIGSGLDDYPTCLINYMDQLFVLGAFETNGNGNALPGIAVVNDESLVAPDWEETPEQAISIRDAFVVDNMLVINGWSNQGNFFSSPEASWRVHEGRFYQNELAWLSAETFEGEVYVIASASGITTPLHFYAESGLFKLDMNGTTTAQMETDHLAVQFRTLGNLFQMPSGFAPGITSPEIDPFGSLVFAAGLWYSASENDNLYAVNPQYDNGGEEPTGTQLYYGPYSECYDEAYLKRYYRTWTLTREMIENHLENYDSPGYYPPEPLLNYPATGRTWCDESSLLAPFNDLNENGLYEPAQGETPIIHGDQSVFLLMHDQLSGLSESPGFESLIEVYMFDTEDEQLANTVYLNMSVRNRSGRDYEEVKLGFWTDLDLGSAVDDRIGCSVDGNYYYAYNGTASDPGSSGSGPFDEDVPAVGVAFLNRSLDSFINLSNSFGPTGSPNIAPEINHILSGNWKTGESILLGGNGHPSGGAWDPPVEMNHVFPDFPWETSEGSWSEVTEDIPPTDRTGVGATSIGPLADRSSVCFDVAIVVAYPDNAEDMFSEVAVLDAAMPGVQSAYSNENESCTWQGTPISVEEPDTDVIAVFPNPTDAILTIQLASARATTFELYDMQGRLTESGQFNGRQNTIDLSSVPSGMYILNVQTPNTQVTHRIVVR